MSEIFKNQLKISYNIKYSRNCLIAQKGSICPFSVNNFINRKPFNDGVFPALNGFLSFERLNKAGCF